MTKRRPVRVRGPHALRRRATGPVTARLTPDDGSVIEAAVSRALERSEAGASARRRYEALAWGLTIALLLTVAAGVSTLRVPSAFAVSAIAPDLTPGGNGAAIDLANPRDPWAFIVETAPTIVLLGAAVDIRTALPPGNCASVAATLGGECTPEGVEVHGLVLRDASLEVYGAGAAVRFEFTAYEDGTKVLGLRFPSLSGVGGSARATSVSELPQSASIETGGDSPNGLVIHVQALGDGNTLRGSYPAVSVRGDPARFSIGGASSDIALRGWNGTLTIAGAPLAVAAGDEVRLHPVEAQTAWYGHDYPQPAMLTVGDSTAIEVSSINVDGVEQLPTYASAYPLLLVVFAIFATIAFERLVSSLRWPRRSRSAG